jgi:hypothetical protein
MALLTVKYIVFKPGTAENSFHSMDVIEQICDLLGFYYADLDKHTFLVDKHTIYANVQLNTEQVERLFSKVPGEHIYGHEETSKIVVNEIKFDL